MSYLQELRNKWLPIFKSGNINGLALKLYEADVRSYKRANPNWRETTQF